MCLKKFNRFKPYLEIILSVSGIISICYTLFSLILKPLFFPTITVECLPKIDSYESYVWTKFYPNKPNYSIEFFVKPNDGHNRYYLQYKNDIIRNNGLYMNKLRFGNPKCIDMIKCPPLEFYIYAVLIKNKYLSRLPIICSDSMWISANDETVFFNKLKTAKYSAISKNTIFRVPENKCYDSKPIIISPKVNYGNKPLISEVEEKFKLSWSPSIEMYMEIRNQGDIIKKGYIISDTIINLNSGLYEITLMQRPGFECFEKIWIKVLSK